MTKDASLQGGPVSGHGPGKHVESSVPLAVQWDLLRHTSGSRFEAIAICRL